VTLDAIIEKTSFSEEKEAKRLSPAFLARKPGRACWRGYIFVHVRRHTGDKLSAKPTSRRQA
jgi:hypothetical protein